MSARFWLSMEEIPSGLNRNVLPVAFLTTVDRLRQGDVLVCHTVDDANWKSRRPANPVKYHSVTE